jgi:hypothetical protein
MILNYGFRSSRRASIDSSAAKRDDCQMLFPIRTTSTGTRSRRPELAPACVALAMICLLALPAWSQTNCPQNPTGPINTPAHGACGSFFDCFVNNNNIGCYGIQLTGNNGGTFQGDLNSKYYNLFYSITNANALGNGASPYELILVGTFPNTRYFSITDNDMHYSNAQHLADFTIDPIGCRGGAGVPITRIHSRAVNRMPRANGI